MAEESSTGTDQLQDSLEEVTVAGKKSYQEEIKAEVPALSVAEEIRKIQQEINKVGVENGKYLARKQQRPGGEERQEPMNKEMNNYQPQKLHQQGQSVLQHTIAGPELPKRKNVSKKVSYAKNEVTVFTFTEEAANSLTVIPEMTNNRSSSHQINPAKHIAPAYPPTAGGYDLNLKHTEDTKSDADNDTEYVPVLPSVKLLATKFQAVKTKNSKPAVATKR